MWKKILVETSKKAQDEMRKNLELKEKIQKQIQKAQEIIAKAAYKAPQVANKVASTLMYAQQDLKRISNKEYREIIRKVSTTCKKMKADTSIKDIAEENAKLESKKPKFQKSQQQSQITNIKPKFQIKSMSQKLDQNQLNLQKQQYEKLKNQLEERGSLPEKNPFMPPQTDKLKYGIKDMSAVDIKKDPNLKYEDGKEEGYGVIDPSEIKERNFQNEFYKEGGHRNTKASKDFSKERKLIMSMIAKKNKSGKYNPGVVQFLDDEQGKQKLNEYLNQTVDPKDIAINLNEKDLRDFDFDLYKKMAEEEKEKEQDVEKKLKEEFGQDIEFSEKDNELFEEEDKYDEEKEDYEQDDEVKEFGNYKYKDEKKEFYKNFDKKQFEQFHDKSYREEYISQSKANMKQEEWEKMIKEKEFYEEQLNNQQKEIQNQQQSQLQK